MNSNRCATTHRQTTDRKSTRRQKLTDKKIFIDTTTERQRQVADTTTRRRKPIIFLYKIIVNQEVASKVPAAAKGAIPKEPSMRRVVQRERRKHMPKAPSSISEIDLSGQWSVTNNGESLSYMTAIMTVGKYSYLKYFFSSFF